MAVIQVTTSAKFMQVLRWYFVIGTLVDLSVAIMELTVSVAIMQVVFSAVHFAHGYFYCIYVGHSFFYSHVGDSFKLKFHIPFTD